MSSFKESLAQHIEKVETFDLDTVHPDVGFKTIHWLMADSYLNERGYTQYEKYIEMPGVVGLIKNALYPSREILEAKGIRVYFVIPQKTKIIKVITTDPEYSEAAQKDFDRMVSRINYTIKSVRSQLEFRHPRLIGDKRRILADIRRLSNRCEKQLTIV